MRPPCVAIGQAVSSNPLSAQPESSPGSLDVHLHAGEVIVVSPQLVIEAMMAAGPPVSMPWIANTLPSPQGAAKW